VPVSSVALTPSQIASFKARGICTYILNVCDEDLQLWIRNNISKIQSDGPVLFKILSTKIIQYTRAFIYLTRASLHTMTLKNHNNNVEKLVNEIEGKIKLLSCGSEDPNSIFADIFRIFFKASNEEFCSLV